MSTLNEGESEIAVKTDEHMGVTGNRRWRERGHVKPPGIERKSFTASAGKLLIEIVIHDFSYLCYLPSIEKARSSFEHTSTT